VSLLGDFKKFLLRGNVVDLAVVIGTAFGLVVKASSRTC
jgi:large-conductance mechanosensitive channel